MPSTTRRFGAATVHVFDHPVEAWHLAIATHAAEGSGKLSLGGFRIAPRALVEEPGFDPDRMAAELAHGMDEKVYWSRVLGVGGPLARRDSARIVGGKCVLVPTDDARVGQPRDRELLDWAIDCLRAFDERSGIHVVTGQDLGHGIMSDGSTTSLDYMARRFRGCVDADTSKPTGEGNLHLLAGMLAGFDIPVARASVGLVGIGNIGMHILRRLRDAGATVLAVDASDARRAEAEALGARVFAPSHKGALLAEPIDALVVNANKESLDADAVHAVVRNDRIRVICGSENLAMPDPTGAETFRAARRAYAPTELGGMMGYLTAVEEYLAVVEGEPFAMQELFHAARDLEPVGERVVRHLRARDFAIGFEDGARALYASPG